MNRTIALLLAAVVTLSFLPFASATEPIELFNGKDLSGWTYRAPNPDAESPFSVKEGILRCEGQPVGYLRTDEEYTSYVLTLQWRWPKDSQPGNNGVLLRIQPEEHVFNDTWPKCVEAQLLNQHAGDIFTIANYPLTGDPERTKGRYTAKAHPSNEKPQGEWNTYEIILDGENLTLKVNGLVQNEATGVAVMPGYVAVQSEGAPIEYRNIQLTPLEK